MPRSGPSPRAGLTYLVQQRGHDGGAICRNRADLHALRRCLRAAAKTNSCRIHAYVLLEFEFFVLLTAPGDGGVADTVNAVRGSYTPWFMAMYGWVDAIWDDMLRTCVVEPDRHVLDCYRFVEQQGKQPASVDESGRLRWSSADGHKYGWADQLVADHPIFLGLGGTLRERAAAYNGMSGQVLPDRAWCNIRRALVHRSAYASDTYKRRLARNLV